MRVAGLLLCYAVCVVHVDSLPSSFSQDAFQAMNQMDLSSNEQCSCQKMTNQTLCAASLPSSITWCTQSNPYITVLAFSDVIFPNTTHCFGNECFVSLITFVNYLACNMYTYLTYIYIYINAIYSFIYLLIYVYNDVFIYEHMYLRNNTLFHMPTYVCM